MVLKKSHIGEYAIIINDKKEFLLVQWGKEFNYTWHFLGGLLDAGEKETEGLIREAKEELNADINILKPVFTKYISEEYKWKPQDVTRYAVFYLAKIKNSKKLKTDNKEIVGFKWPFYKEMLEKIL